MVRPGVKKKSLIDPNTKKSRKAIGKMSKNKGAEGERAMARELIKRGFPARRGRQFSGGDDSPDVICEDLNFLNIEVKRVEKLNIYRAIRQSKEDAGMKKVPIVAHKTNRNEWLVSLPLYNFMDIIQCLLGREDELNSLWEKLDANGLVGDRSRNIRGNDGDLL